MAIEISKKEDIKREKAYSSVSYSFKISVVVLLFILTLLRLALLIYFPKTGIVSDKVFLFIVLFIVSYLWTQELVDFHSLLTVNKDLQETQEHLKEAEINAIASLIKAEEARDLYTRGHSERVTNISLAIAEEMNLSSESKKIISRAGLLHDIGKIGIGDDILHKKEKLTDVDWQIIKSHPENAVKILLPLKFLSAEREVILSHHERYDGKGYPQGLKGENICLEALILAVADAFDAMNSKRPYREPLTKDAIMGQLVKCRGNQHSMDVIDAFLVLLKKRPQLWRR